MRLIPGRIAGQWGRPSLDIEVGELENVLFCSERSLSRVRRKLAIEGEGAVYVRLDRCAPKPAGSSTDAQAEAREEQEEEQGLEGWLAGWDEMPDGCCVLAGPDKEGWTGWQTVKSVLSC